jgi:hypothetical protein
MTHPSFNDGDKVRLSAEGQRYVTRHMDNGQTTPSLDDVFPIIDGGVQLSVSYFGVYVWFLRFKESDDGYVGIRSEHIVSVVEGE